MIGESGNRFSEKINSSAARNHLLRFLCASGLIVVMAAALNFIVDPLQLFRPARLFAAMYSPDSRMQDAGLIRSQDISTRYSWVPRLRFTSGRAISTGCSAGAR
jgi:hypothetical protein